MLDNTNISDNNADDVARTWGTHITVSGQTYATSLFWQPLQNQEEPITEIIEASEGILEGADLYCIKPGKAPQFGICVSQEGYKGGTVAAAVSLATALADRSSFIAVFKVPEGWWYTCVRNDIILSDGDMLFLNEEDARNQFTSMLAVPDWGRKIAPESWNIEDVENIQLEHILQRGTTAKLQKIKGLRGAKLLMVVGISVVVGLWLISSLIDALLFTPVERPVVVPVQPKVVKKVERAPVIKPWEKLKNPAQIMSSCVLGIRQFKSILPPGWDIGTFSCSQNGVTTSWTRTFGRMSWMKMALDKTKFKVSYANFANDGNSVAAGINYPKIEVISSPPTLSIPKLRETLNNLFQSIGGTITLNNGSFSQAISEDERYTYRYIGFSFTSTYNPLVWSSLLTKFSGLDIKVINYNGSDWTYEGAIYAL